MLNPSTTRGVDEPGRLLPVSRCAAKNVPNCSPGRIHSQTKQIPATNNFRCPLGKGWVQATCRRESHTGRLSCACSEMGKTLESAEERKCVRHNHTVSACQMRSSNSRKGKRMRKTRCRSSLTWPIGLLSLTNAECKRCTCVDLCREPCPGQELMQTPRHRRRSGRPRTPLKLGQDTVLG